MSSSVRGTLLLALLVVLVNRRCDCHEQNNQLAVDAEIVRTTSSCSYKVEPVTVRHGCSLKQLYHVICTNTGDKCSGPDEDHPYKCVQTFKTINFYHKKVLTPMRLYTGCVCAYKAENTTDNSSHYKD